MSGNLYELRSDWERWSRNAAQTENGWQSDYPRWNDLVSAAIAAMIDPAVNDADLEVIEQCWAISEETEDLADFAKAHLELCWAVLRRLATSKCRDVRWQIYSVLGLASHKPEAAGFLRTGLNDPDPYCRRRALLALAQLKPHGARQLAEQYLRDSDPYMRQVANDIIRNCSA